MTNTQKLTASQARTLEYFALNPGAYPSGGRTHEGLNRKSAAWLQHAGLLEGKFTETDEGRSYGLWLTEAGADALESL